MKKIKYKRHIDLRSSEEFVVESDIELSLNELNERIEQFFYRREKEERERKLKQLLGSV